MKVEVHGFSVERLSEDFFEECESRSPRPRFRLWIKSYLRAVMMCHSFSRETVAGVAIDVDFPVRLDRQHLGAKGGDLVERYQRIGVTMQNQHLPLYTSHVGGYRRRQLAVQRDKPPQLR